MEYIGVVFGETGAERIARVARAAEAEILRLRALNAEMLEALEFAYRTYQGITTEKFGLGGDNEARERMKAAIEKARSHD